MSGTPITWTDEVLEQAARGDIEVTRFSRPVPFKLNKAERIEFEASKKRGYVISPPRRTSPVETCYGTWCEIHELPLVNIRRAVRFANIAVDMIFCPGRLDAAAMNQINVLRAVGIRGFAGKRGDYEDDAENIVRVSYALLEKIPNAEAERVAADAYRVATECLARKTAEAPAT